MDRKVVEIVFSGITAMDVVWCSVVVGVVAVVVVV